ncbi:MAG: hypothetical protein ACODAJ_15945 [Planctomycetota bacterium]
MLYQRYDLRRDAELALNYLTRMVDPACDYLPYWLIGANENPAWARHCRVDDAELVASWFEALCAVQNVLGTEAGTEVRQGFETHLLRSWGEHGLRFHEPYPWSNTLHSSFHEMAYIVSALNRWLTREPENEQVRRRLTELVGGMRGLVWERKIRTFWSGDYPFEKPLYEFPNDVYIQGVGWDFERVTGRGEASIRNAMMLQPLVETWERFGDETALDLARGLANHVLGLSRYFNWRGEFFGHVHSAVWFAGGCVRLGRLTGERRYVERGRDILGYVLGLSSAFGWVPEYAQWHPMSEEHCETCCIKDVIFTSFELIAAGFPEYWDVVNRFVRNQLSEQQIKTGAFVGVDNTIPDTEEATFREIDQRIVGGWSGGGEPASISLRRFRSVAGCCVGTAPQALEKVWDHIVTRDGGRTTVNLPIDREHERATVATGYPNEGWLEVTVQRGGAFAVRVHPFMERRLRLTVSGRERPVWLKGGCVEVPRARKGTVIRLEHDLKEEVRTDTVRAVEYAVTWKGCDVVDIAPRGEPLRLYQRVAGQPREVPPPPPRGTAKPKWFDARPTEQKQ